MVTILGEGAVVGGYRVRGHLFHTALFDAYSAVDRRGLSFCVLCSEHGGRRPLPSDDDAARGIEALRALKSRWLPTVVGGGRNERLAWIVTEPLGDTRPLWSPGAPPVHWLRLVIAAKFIGDAMRSADAAGIYHESLEPQCLRVRRDGRMCVVGVGAARVFGLDQATIHASPRYFAPEQVTGVSLPGRASADIYAFAMCFYAAIFGREPFEGATPEDLVHIAPYGSLPIVFSDGIPTDMWEWLALSAKKDPTKRLHDWLSMMHMARLVFMVGMDDVDRYPGMQEAVTELAMELPTIMGPDTLREFEQRITAGRAKAEEEGAEADAGAGAEAEAGADAEAGTDTDTDTDTDAPASEAPDSEPSSPGPTTQRAPVLQEMWTVDLPRLPPQQDVDVPKQKPHPPRPQPAPATRAGRPLVAGALVGSLALFAVGALSALLWGANARDSIELAKAAPLPTVFVVGPPDPALPQRSRLSAKPQRPPAAPPPAASEKAAIDPRNPWVGVACRDPDFFRCTPLPPLD